MKLYLRFVLTTSLWLGLGLSAPAIRAQPYVITDMDSAQQVAERVRAELAARMAPPSKGQSQPQCQHKGSTVQSDFAPAEAVNNRYTPQPIQTRVQFATNRADILPEWQDILTYLAQSLLQSQIPAQRWQIVGHADERGEARYNLDLSIRRAESVYRFLVRQGVPAQWMQTAGLGESQPLDSASNAAAWTKNRRVELIPPASVVGRCPQ